MNCFPSLKTIEILAIPVDSGYINHDWQEESDLEEGVSESCNAAQLDALAQHLYPIFQFEKWFGEEFVHRLRGTSATDGARSKLDFGQRVIQAKREPLGDADEIQRFDGLDVDIVMTELAMEDYVRAVRGKGLEWWKDIWGIPNHVLVNYARGQ
ncbi:hypothetical protein BDN72DRAFT_859536 [Pluteus cervinus]|uniref:Uncharacterized protein n=1 Tax=Pluteus cervinus TaxID=181527 RepID=A0ACD3AN25_9AGAR|nr:hypothetical protein BDN72DRAFT_859536 [Pluteus cervinus]